jgi:flagellar basal body-associated protein FliL
LLIWNEHYYHKILTTFVTNVQSEVDTIVRADIAISTYLPSTVGENYQMQMSAFEPMMVSAVLNFLGNMKKSDFIGSENLEFTSNEIKFVINEALKKQDARYFVDNVHFFELAMNDGQL